MTQGLSRTLAACVAGLAAAVAIVVGTQLISDTDVGAKRLPDETRDRGASASRSDGSLPHIPRSFAVTGQDARPARSQVNDARPQVVHLPSGTEVPLQPSATSGEGLLQVPRNIDAAGWWDGGARLGERYGAMLVAGHVDSSSQGLGPFAELLGVRRGQFIDVSADGQRQQFAVTTVDLVPDGTLTRRPDLFSQRGPLRLILVTCAGPFIPAQGGYQNLAIVTAVPTGALSADPK